MPPFPPLSLSSHSWQASERRKTASNHRIHRRYWPWQYRAYREKCAFCAIPTMCVLTIKPDEMLRPHCAKVRIVFSAITKIEFGLNQINMHWYSIPILFNSLLVWRSSNNAHWNRATAKNAFCQGILPPDKITIVKPPIGNLDAKKDEYWLHHKPRYGLH